jgi:hypothetical protein
MKHLLIFPMAFYVFYMSAVLMLMFATRVRGIKSGTVDFKFFKTYSATKPLPDFVAVVGRHYDNQFQLPILFFITCCVYMILDSTNLVTVILAWLFVSTRLIHSLIHLGNNKVMNRVRVFGAGWIIVLIMWGFLVANAV